MDGDKDLDVLLTNGDVFDRRYILKPYHGVQWLEDSGGYPVKHHPIAAMHGASKAVAADLSLPFHLSQKCPRLCPQLRQ